MNIRIRPARPSDAAGIARVHVDAWRETYPGILSSAVLDRLSYEEKAEMHQEWVPKSGRAICYYVATSSEHGVIGFTMAGPERTENAQYTGEIYGLYLLKSYHGRGIGRRLFHATARWLSRNHHDAMLVWVLTDNPATGFYQHLGGQRLGARQIDIGGLVDEVSYGWDDLRSKIRTL